MKNKSMKLEDCEDQVEPTERETHKLSKKKTKSENNIISNNPDNDVFIEYILMDFRNLEDLNKFKNMKSLSLIQQGITSIEPIAKSQFSNQIEFLCLNENLLCDLNYVDQLKNLRNLQVNFNNIEIIDNVKSLSNLETFWICENRIKYIENLSKNIKYLWIAKNNIERIDESIKEYSNLLELNISANLMTSLKDISNLSYLNNLKILYINDTNFEENPVCLLNNYRIYTLHYLPNLSELDQITITDEERIEVESTFSKKNLFYKTKIKNMNKTTKSIMNMLKCYKTFYTIMKFLQIKFFSKRVKMLEFIEYENNFKNKIENENVTEISKELESSKEKLKKCLRGIENVNRNFKILKDFISEINDFQIVK